MREFQQKPGRLARLPVGARVLYSIYLVYALVALVVAANLMRVGPGVSAESAAVYYAGSEGQLGAAPPAAPPAPEPDRVGVGDGPELDLPPAGATGPVLDLPPTGGGPALELPPDARLDVAAPPVPEAVLAGHEAGVRLAVAFNERRLLEITHGHLFMMPLFFLVIAHLFVLAGLRPAVTVPFVLVGALAIGAHIAAPWLIRSSPTGWAWLMPLSGVAMLGSLGGMALISLVVMWWPRAERSAA